MNLDFNYIFLNLLLLGIFIFVGHRISAGRPFWKNAIWCILAFTFVQGTRYLRGNDYMSYANMFEDAARAKQNLSFAYINQFLAHIGFSKYSCFMAYAFVFSLCGMSFLRTFEKYAKWTFPMFILGFMINQEYMIRQMFSYSFFFLYLKYLFKIDFTFDNFTKKLRPLIFCVIWGWLCYSIHSANAINIFIFTLLYLTFRLPIHYIFSIPTYLYCVYILPESIDYTWIELLVGNFADQNDMVARYAEHSSKWFSEEAIDENYTRNYYVQLLECFGTSALFFLGYKTISLMHKVTQRTASPDYQDRKFNYVAMSLFLNTFFVGVCIISLFREIELLNRIGVVMNMMWCMVLAYVMYSYRFLPSLKKFRIVYILLVWFAYEYLKYLLFPGDMTLFIWDAPFTVSFF